ncbi:MULTISPECIES: DUF317 domain-containing protein [Streptomyces]|uniref:DUF317 domain-containing protein n=1 Tax=Streptomyces fimbriatus TaxID=68197 RepID=A0ABW0DFW5_STRFI
MKRKQWQGWGAGEQAQQHYLVEPRALAGGGDLRHVSEFLRASGWRDKSKAGGPLAMESPDRAVRITYDPFVLPGGWTIHGAASGHQKQWWAVLGRQTPVEIVAGLTDALTRPRSAHAPEPVMRPLGRVPQSAQIRTTSVSVLPSQLSAWQQARITAARAATWARNAARSSRPRTTARPHTNAGGARTYR